MTVTCDLCGRQADEVDTLTWSTSNDRGRRSRYCDTCSRQHLRAMEGKLDPEHW
jgi:hypothetical protein